ncbi:hypothetical protein HY439_01340 [Candidatus Microgenomates bacterium]|nr:hypothetical protein [Candidatus Microgenomates bacterium]
MRQERTIGNIHEHHPRKNPYGEYLTGDEIKFSLQTLQSDGSLRSCDQRIVIRDVRGGGFFGRVIIPEDGGYVIKTSCPDSWHHLWREVNWDFKPFPARVFEIDAQLEHLSTRLIHQVLPRLSGGKFRSPDSFGYTDLPNGFAQVVEKMEGRGPRFDLPKNEFLEFRQAQEELTDLALRLGLEQAGQIHPENPFGMANLWKEKDGHGFIWLDTIPAIPHNGWIKPFFHFKFHKKNAAVVCSEKNYF